MRTSFGLFVFACICVAPLATLSAREISWTASYQDGQVQGTKAGKPLAVFVGNGSTGREQLTPEGLLDADVKTTLADRYVCVYVDASRPENQAILQQLQIKSGRGLVISDRTGEVQAFHHDGILSSDELSRQLFRFADSAVDVKTTATLVPPVTQVSYYPPTEPSFSQGSFGGAIRPALFSRPAMSSGNC